jgi:hypothetical protein
VYARLVSKSDGNYVLLLFNWRVNQALNPDFSLMCTTDNRPSKFLLTLDLASPYNGKAEYSIDMRDGFWLSRASIQEAS